MHAIYNYLQENPMVMAALVAFVGYGLWSLISPATEPVRPQDLVPHHERVERRTIERSDRRRQQHLQAIGLERRIAMRRACD